MGLSAQVDRYNCRVTHTPAIVAILLAAGAGTRFGGDKLVQPMTDGMWVGVRSAANLIAAGLPVLAVVKPGDAALAAALAAAGCEVSVCDNAAAGMGHSLAHGIENTRSADGWLIALADMPRIRVSTLERLRDAVREGGIVAPTCNGERGHPVGFEARYLDELLALRGDAGARDVVQRHRSALRLVECGDPGVLLDIDRREDLQQLRDGAAS